MSMQSMEGKGDKSVFPNGLPSCLLSPSTSVPRPQHLIWLVSQTKIKHLFSELFICLYFMQLYTSLTFLTILFSFCTTLFPSASTSLLRFLSNSCPPWPGSYHFTSLCISWDQFSSVLHKKTMADGNTKLQMQVRPHTIIRLLNPITISPERAAAPPQLPQSR